MKRYSLYPLDNRWCYYSSVRPLWNEPRPELVSQRADEEGFFIVRCFAERPKEGRPAFFTTHLSAEVVETIQSFQRFPNTTG